MRRIFPYFALLSFFISSLFAQPSRVPARIENDRRVLLNRSIHPRIFQARDEGAVEATFPLQGLILYLKPSDDQKRSLTRFLGELQNPSSPDQRRFLTPEQYADRFGVSSSDIGRISTWLESQGFSVTQVARGRTWIVFRGTAGQVARAFQAEIHQYRTQGQLHYANAKDISIPQALNDIVIGVSGLDDFHPEPEIAQQRPLPDYTSPTGSHFLAPDDIATLYDLGPVYKAGIDGSGVTIAIVGASRMSSSDVQAFRSRFNLPAQVPRSLLVPGFTDPGTNSALVESDLDLQWVGAVARNADLLYVYAPNAFVALAYVIDQNLAHIVSASYRLGCEQTQTPAAITIYQQIAQQANVQGITWVNASGDAGAAWMRWKRIPHCTKWIGSSFSRQHS